MASSDTTTVHTTAGDAPLLGLARHFTTVGTDPFDQVDWEVRDAIIPGKEGANVFEQRGVEFPRSWSQNATNIVAQKYFRGRLDRPDERERSVREMIGRVADTMLRWGREGGYFADDAEAETFHAELKHVLVNQLASFNSPVWFNIGVPGVPQQGSACFILSVDDSMDSILSWIGKEGIIFKGGSGSGINISRIRSSKEYLSGGGLASGPVSFMRGADASAGTIKSGGRTRRAAKMVVLNVDHPDIEDFVWCKSREEEKARALEAAGYDMSLDGDGWTSIQYQNANNSVRVTDDFMEAVERGSEWHTRAVTDPSQIVDTYDARALLRQIAEAAWKCADPGVQYDTTINRWHTSPHSGRINGSNPCFPGDARVHTTEGLLPIADLYERSLRGDVPQVYTHRATAKTAGAGVVATTPVQVMETGVKPIVRLRFADGRTLRCTPNHRVWTTTRGYVRADELTADDRVLLNDSPTPALDAAWDLPVRVTAQATSFARGSTKLHVDLPDRWTTGLGETLGHLTGDGCLTDSSSVWVYGGDDVADGTADRHQEVLEGLFGGASRQVMDNGTEQLRVGSESVRQFLKTLGVTTAKAAGKRVPRQVFEAPAEVQAAYLRGLFGADGCVARTEAGNASRYVGLGSRSDSLLRDVQRLLSGFGVRGSIYTVSGSARPASFTYTTVDGESRSYDAQQGYDLRVSGTDLEVFAREIGFSTARKQAALEALLGETARYRTKGAVTLVAREDDGQEVVYNLTEPLHHSYIVDGVVVANCSEYMHIDNSACNLASLNLMRFATDDGGFDLDSYRQAIRVMFLAQEILVGNSSYPTPEITANAHKFRQLGLGYANLGALLMSRGLPYDSDGGRAYAAALTAIMTGEAYRASAYTAGRVGPHEGFEVNRAPMTNVIQMHRDAVEDIDESLVPGELVAAARDAWDGALSGGNRFGWRNAQASVLAPTGTISFMMDCDTTGIEPDFSLVKVKRLVGGGTMSIVNQGVGAALERLGYRPDQAKDIVDYVSENYTTIGAPHLAAEHSPVFACAIGDDAIHYLGHVKMMGAVQPFLSGAISKTVNMPEEASVEDVMDVYTEGWKLGVKALAIYRDNCKVAQPLGSAKKDVAPADAPAEVSGTAAEADVRYIEVPGPPQRRRMPSTRYSVTHKFSIAGHEGYITAGMYEDGTLGEIFLTDVGKEGSTLRGMMNAFATSFSIGLQYGVPLEVLVRKFSHMRFDPEGMTTNRQIPFAKSMPDYICRWLASQFLPRDVQEELGIQPVPDDEQGRIATSTQRPAADPTQQPLPLPGWSTVDADATAPPPPLAPATGTASPAEAAAAATLGDRPVTVTPRPAPSPGGPLTSHRSSPELGSPCDRCGAMMIRTGACYTCGTCGNNTGCG